MGPARDRSEPTGSGRSVKTTPSASSSAARARMMSQRRRDTLPEVAHRRALFGLGLRYRIDLRIPPLRRRGDIVFTRWKVVVFIDGCFWHSCRWHGTVPKSNREWWVEKLRANVERDRDTDRLLQEAGWRVVRVWEHETPPQALPRILAALYAAGANCGAPVSAVAQSGRRDRSPVRQPRQTAARDRSHRSSGRGAPCRPR